MLCVSFVLSRALSGLAITTFTCAKNSGLAATFSNMAHKKRARLILAMEAVVAMGVMIYVNWILGSLAILGAVLVFCYYRFMSYDKFGGITGDLAGWFLQMAEFVMALAVMIGEKLWF